MTEGFINSTLQVSIPSFSDKFVNQKRTTIYVLNCMSIYTNRKWQLEKEFEDFEFLYNTLGDLLPDPPEFEGGSTLFKVTAYNELQERQTFLENFIRACCVRKDVISTDIFKEFLDLEKQAPEILMKTPVKLSEFNNIPLGIRDFVYLQDEGIIFLACSDMSLASRIDAAITNITLPWEQKTESHISVGAFFVFKVFYNPEKGFKFDKVYAKSYPEQTGCISFNKLSNTVHVGLDTGRIIFYKIDPDSNYNSYEPYIDFKPHTDRVMGLTYDEKTGYIYSVSTDKRFYVTEIGYLSNPSEILEGPAGFTNLYHDRENQRLFLTNEMGMVSVFLINSFPPKLVNNIELSSDASIRGFDISLFKSYLFVTHVNGQITILDINKPGKEKLIKEISNFGGKMKLRLVKYYREKNELITGDEKGRITCWNLKTGKTIYTWRAHQGPITQMVLIPEIKLLISGGKDKYFRTWRLPDKWLNDDVVQFEQNEIKNMSDTIAMLKIQESMKKGEDYNSDEDSLNGWDYRDDFDD